MDTALDIVQRHHNDAWRRRITAEWQDQNGRYTKAKRHARDIAEAEARAIERIVSDLREAGYTITEQ